MIWNTLPVRLFVALLTIGATCAVVFTSGGASAAPRYTLNLSVSDVRPDVGEAVRLNGKVRPAAPGRRVLVQGRAAGTGWVTIARPFLSRSSTYKATVRFPRSGAVSIRVVKPPSRKSAEGISRIRYLRVGAAVLPPVIVTTSLPDGVVGTAYAATVRTADNRPGAFLVASGSLPAGLFLDDQSGVISGTPTTQGTASFEVIFRDPDGLSDTQALSLIVQ